MNENELALVNLSRATPSFGSPMNLLEVIKVNIFIPLPYGTNIGESLGTWFCHWKCAQMVFATNSKRMWEWNQQRKEELDRGEVEAVIKALKLLRVKSEEARVMCQATVRYYEQNKERMRYNIFRAQGFFVGSPDLSNLFCLVE